MTNRRLARDEIRKHRCGGCVQKEVVAELHQKQFSWNTKTVGVKFRHHNQPTERDTILVSESDVDQSISSPNWGSQGDLPSIIFLFHGSKRDPTLSYPLTSPGKVEEWSEGNQKGRPWKRVHSSVLVRGCAGGFVFSCCPWEPGTWWPTSSSLCVLRVRVQLLVCFAYWCNSPPQTIVGTWYLLMKQTAGTAAHCYSTCLAPTMTWVQSQNNKRPCVNGWLQIWALNKIERLALGELYLQCLAEDFEHHESSKYNWSQWLNEVIKPWVRKLQ